MARKDPHADAFKAAFDKKFLDKYIWQAGDFVQLTKFRKDRPEVTSERFVVVAKYHWNHTFTMPSSLTIRGLTTNWAALASRLPQVTTEYRKADHVSTGI